jgi:SulP family sulfate permease
VAGIVHAFTLLLIVLFVGRWAALIPMATLAGILVIVAYNMSEWENFISVMKGSRSDIAVLLTTFLLTILVDLTVAIEIGMILAVFLFIRKLARSSAVSNWRGTDNEEDAPGGDSEAIDNYLIPKQVEVFEITGPLFFGAAYKFREAMKQIEKSPKVLIVRMRQVPVIDATGIRALKEVYKESRHRGTKLILSEVRHEQVMKELKDARLLFSIGKANVTKTFELALKRCRQVIADDYSRITVL